MNAWGQTLSSWFSLQRAGGAASVGPLPVRLGGRGSFAATTQVPQTRGFDQPLV